MDEGGFGGMAILLVIGVLTGVIGYLYIQQSNIKKQIEADRRQREQDELTALGNLTATAPPDLTPASTPEITPDSLPIITPGNTPEVIPGGTPLILPAPSPLHLSDPQPPSAPPDACGSHGGGHP